MEMPQVRLVSPQKINNKPVEKITSHSRVAIVLEPSFQFDAQEESVRQGLERRQTWWTCGLMVLAVIVSAGMAEWSKRSAADEVIVTEKILQEAIQIAAEARDSGIKGLRDSESGKRKAEIVIAPARWGLDDRFAVGDGAATMPTSAGGQ